MKIREEISKKFIFLFRGRITMNEGIILRMVIIETVIFPKKYYYNFE